MCVVGRFLASLGLAGCGLVRLCEACWGWMWSGEAVIRWQREGGGGWVRLEEARLRLVLLGKDV